MTTTYRKKLIEVALPLDAINREAAREKEPFTRNHPRSLHVWWARRPLVVCRAVLFASLIDDPSSHPDKFPTEEAQEMERQRLFRLIEQLVKWENSDNETMLEKVRAEIRSSSASEGTPPVYDPFCGGGSIPIESQRLGLDTYAGDLNPVAVLITKALTEIPREFADSPPANPKSQIETLKNKRWPGAQGLAEDIRYYGRWIREEAEKRIGHLYPPIELSAEDGGGTATVTAWLWARTVVSPNPAAKGAHVPLVRSFWLSTKGGKKIWIDPVVDESRMTYGFRIASGEGEPIDGTVNRNGAVCLLTESPIPLEYIRAEGRAGRLGRRLLAIVARSNAGRLYLPPSDAHERIAEMSEPSGAPETDLPVKALSFRVYAYGMRKHKSLFTERQLSAMITLTTLVQELHAHLVEEGIALRRANAITTYLGLAVSRWADLSNALCSWNTTNQNIRALFARQAIPMAWDFAELSPFGSRSPLESIFEGAAGSLMGLSPAGNATIRQRDATKAPDVPSKCLVSTDPPYYDNIGYADLSDFFYIWLRKALSDFWPELFGTVLTPKTEELIATPFRHDGSREAAQKFFEQGLTHVFERLRNVQHENFPLSVYYAFKQTESEAIEGDADVRSVSASTGWETMLHGLLKAEFSITGTWPMRTERGVRSVGLNTNALASSILIVCRPRPKHAGITSRRDFLSELKKELPAAVRHLQKGHIAPVDLAQSAIGPGMAVFSRYDRVLETDGTPMKIRTALGLINQALDEVLAEQEGEFDADTRWAVAWFDQYGFSDGPYGAAETLSTAKNTSVSGMAGAGILIARAGKVRLLGKDELTEDWDPTTENRFTIWEATHHLIRALENGGEQATADLIKILGGDHSERARDLTYRLYTICERNKWSKEALPYNVLAQAWAEATRLAAVSPRSAEKISQPEFL
jgi:putative DNA methylase